MKTSHDELTSIVHTFRPGADVGPLVPLKGGISSGVAAFDVTSKGKTERLILREPGEWALKRDPYPATTEFAVLSELKRQKFPAQKPLYASPREADYPILIIEYLHGELNFRPSDMSHYVGEVARMLARLHRLDVEAFEFMPSMNDEVASTIVQRPERREPVEDELFIRELLESHWPFADQNPPVLLHGDFWPGNILWTDETILAPIDWEDSGIGDPVLDVAATRQELTFAFDASVAAAFTQAYRSLTDLDWTNLPLWELYISLCPIDQFSVWASGWADLGRPEMTADTMRAARADIVTRALEVLGA